jgi:hypothetical protein
MRRAFTFTTCALTCAFAAATLVAQTQTAPPAQQPPATQPPATQPPAGEAKKLELAFTTDAGLLLVQIKKDQTAVFEELIAKLRAGAAKTTDETVKKQLATLKTYKASEDMAGNALYVVLIDPAVKDAEYAFFQILLKTLTPEEQRAPEMQEFFKRAAPAFVTMNKINLTPVGGQ